MNLANLHLLPSGSKIERLAEQRVHRIHLWVVPTPSPVPTPADFWKTLDRAAIKKMRLTPADEQIVVLSARRGNGDPSKAPHIMRVELTPGIVHEKTVMHMRILASPEANGAYVRFLIWEIGVPPVQALVLSPKDPDYPSAAVEVFERDYVVPPIPRIYRGRTYQAEVIVTGREGFAAGAFVPLRVN